MALTAFPDKTAASYGIAQVALRKCFFDPVEAVKALHTVPDDDLLRVVGQYIPEKLRPLAVDMIKRLEKPDWAIFIACLGNAYHGGYATALTDIPQNLNLHQEYLDAQRPANPNGARPNHG